jgi:hypothetical protein
MKYLESFLKEKSQAEKPLPLTDKTDKPPSVSFVGDSRARPSTRFLPNQTSEAVAERTELTTRGKNSRPPDPFERSRIDARALLNRLKFLTLSDDRKAAAREVAERSALRVPPRSKEGSDDPSVILHVLRNMERELTELGATPDSNVQAAVDAVTAVFPGARLVEVRKLRP